MKHLLSTRDIIRLYHTQPIPERIICRSEEWSKKLEEIKASNNVNFVFTRLIEMLCYNVWIAQHVLPQWFTTKYHIHGDKLTYKTKPRRSFNIASTYLSAQVNTDIVEMVIHNKIQKGGVIIENDIGRIIYCKDESLLVERK